MVLAIRRAWLRLNAKLCTPLAVVSDRIMRSGLSSGHPVENAVTKSAVPVGFVITDVLSLTRSQWTGLVDPWPSLASILPAQHSTSYFARCQDATIRRYEHPHLEGPTTSPMNQ